MRMLVACALLIGCASSPSSSTSFLEDAAHWRAERTTRLTAEAGWLSLVGLDWLREGENRFGADTANEVVLPLGTPVAGTFVVEGGKVRLVPQVPLAVNGKPLSGPVEIRTDESGSPDKITFGDFSLTVIKRGDKLGVRARNPNSPARTGFHGLDYFPAAEKYRITAEFVRAETPRELQIPTVLGTVETMPSPGVLRFTLDGKPYELLPVLEEPGATELFIIFRDQTADDATYQSGRFLYAELPKDGKVVLDFNRAYNPPCAFTDFATCPLPPKENVLPVRIEAGEKRYGAHH